MRFEVDSKIVIQLIVCSLVPISLPSFAADLFESEKVLVVKLSGPLNVLIRNTLEEQAYPFVLQADGIDHQIKVLARGNSRKKICSFPLLQLNFEKAVPEGSVFYKNKNLKLVTHCKNSASAQANMLKEFAAYKFFSLLTNAAYRVRLLHIDYADTSNEHSTRQWAFLIEPTAAMAKRIGGEPVKQSGVSLKSLNDQQEALVYVFQYLIGNTDWSLVRAETSDACCHNGRLVKKKHDTLYVPYDFDLAGLVNASYARPDASLRIRKVTRRLYRGFCMDPQSLGSAIRKIQSHQNDFSRIIGELPAMSESEKSKALQFLEGFFKQAINQEKMLKSFERKCLG